MNRFFAGSGICSLTIRSVVKHCISMVFSYFENTLNAYRCLTAISLK
jgi:hypothetical protein